VSKGKEDLFSFKLFAGENWQAGAAGLFRVMLGEAWVGGREVRLVTLAAAMEMVREAACGVLGMEYDPHEATMPPEIQRGATVRVRVEEPDGLGSGHELARVRTEPMRDERGMWWVRLCGRRGLVPAAAVEVVR